MDTSSFAVYNRLCGTEQIPIAEIPAGTWVQVIRDLIQKPEVLKAKELFVRMSDAMKDRHLASAQVPRGLTKFEPGLGINTIVCPFGRDQKKRDGADEWMKTNVYLLLENGAFALWYQRAVRSGTNWVATDSQIWRLNEDQVAYEFTSNPYVPFSLVDRIWSRLHTSVEGLRSSLNNTMLLEKELAAILARVRR